MCACVFSHLAGMSFMFFSSAFLQGGLDMQYLSQRYNRGKEAVEQLMEKRHTTVTHRSINLAHGDIVEKQASLGPAALLD